MSSNDFYASIPPINQIREITDTRHYRAVPPDWYIAITDVSESTRAIERGRYKDVNAVAVASIAALLNLDRAIEMPFVFGGDGATVLIPPDLETAAQHALLASRQLAHQSFDLDLRAALVPVQTMLERGYPIRVAKMHISDNFQQAIFMGSGLAQAERLIKHSTHGKPYRLEADGDFEGDFSGFECRWNKVRSPHEETVSLMVLATDPDPAQQVATYQAVLERIEAVYGSSDQRHPIQVDRMQMALNPLNLMVEAKVRHQDRGWRRWRRLFRMWRYSIMAKIAMRFDLQGWRIYPSLLVASTDHEKFDGTLRMTIAGTADQRQQINNFLEIKRQQGQLIFGIHTSPYALITCIVYDYFGKQAHFVDAADGGYALAAKQMKRQTLLMPIIEVDED